MATINLPTKLEPVQDKMQRLLNALAEEDGDKRNRILANIHAFAHWLKKSLPDVWDGICSVVGNVVDKIFSFIIDLFI